MPGRASGPARRRLATASRRDVRARRSSPPTCSSSPTAWAASRPASRPARWPSRSSPRRSPGGSAPTRPTPRRSRRRSATPSPRPTRRSSAPPERSTEFSNMGTTVVLALFRNDRVYVAGIGDSRAYRLRDGRLEQLTKDHSLADALLEAGTITTEELPEPQVQERPLSLPRQQGRPGRPRGRPGPRRPARRPVPAGQRRPDRRRPRRRARARSSRPVDDPQRAAKVLKDQALANDSKDNVTCLVIHVSSEPTARWRRPRATRSDRGSSTTARDARRAAAPSDDSAVDGGRRSEVSGHVTARRLRGRTSPRAA